MRARSIDGKRASPATGLLTAAMLTASLIAFGAAEAQERSPDIRPRAATGQLTASTSEPGDLAVDQAIRSVTLRTNAMEAEPWDSFRQSVAGAATSSCFGPDALAHEEVPVGGLLRLPFLVHAAATSACR